MTLMRFSLLFLSVCLLFPLVSGYTDASFTVKFQLSPEKVHVVEKITFLLDNDVEKSAFSDSLRLGRSTISDWRTYSRYFDYHAFGPLIEVNSTRIVAKQDFSQSHAPAVVSVEYDVDPSLLLKTVKSSRVTEYAVNTSLLNLNKLRSGEIVVGSIDEFTFEIPEGTSFSQTLPEPQSRGNNFVSFKGPLTSKFEISFIEEKTLSEEVNLFFVSLFSNAANLIPLLLVLALLLFIWFKLVSDN